MTPEEALGAAEHRLLEAIERHEDEVRRRRTQHADIAREQALTWAVVVQALRPMAAGL